MIERKDGAIIIVSSIGGLKGSEAIGAYCVSKAADMQLALQAMRFYAILAVRKPDRILRWKLLALLAV